MTFSTLEKTNPLQVGSAAGASGLKDFQGSEFSTAGFSEDARGDGRRENKRRSRSIRKEDIAELSAQLAIMTKSGVDIASAISSLSAQCQHEALAEVLDEISEAVLAGNTLSDALRQHQSVFEANFIATVAAGEASGRMSEVLSQLAKMQRREIRSRRTIKALMTYPVLLMLVSGSVVVALILFVLPRFTEIFKQYEIDLPWITQMLIGTSAELTTRWWLWGPALACVIGGLLAWRATESGREMIDRMWLHGVVVGEVCRVMLIGRTCRMMGLMLENGVPLLDTLQLTKQSIDNVLYKELLNDMEEAVVNGRTLASVLQETEIVPPSAAEMLATAECTGNLSEVARLLGDHYEEEAEAGTQKIVGLLEPIITVGMGAVVAVIVLAVMLPVFDLSTVAQSGH